MVGILDVARPVALRSQQPLGLRSFISARIKRKYTAQDDELCRDKTYCIHEIQS